MRTLITLAFLAILMVAAFCYESHESMESHEFASPFINRRHANVFIRTPQRRHQSLLQERIRQRFKTPQEYNREICDDYNPCERYAMRNGYIAAYRRFFGQRKGK